MAVQRCSVCNGNGSKRRDIYIGRCQLYAGTSTNPNIICPRCQGKGFIISKK